jgi:Xaa-Pro aminopeptidase
MKLTSRLQRLTSLEGVENSLILRPEDVRWLTGFTGGTSFVLVNRSTSSAILFVDGRYYDRALSEIENAATNIDVRLLKSGESMSSAIASVVQAQDVGVDLDHITASRFDALTSQLSVVSEPTAMNDLRRVKEEWEIDLMARAAKIADDALALVLADGLVGRTEKQVRNRLDSTMRDNGADDVSFSTIVATGANGARPHHEPSETLIESGHGVVIDFGAEVSGYRSDMTRTIQIGDWSAEYRHLYDTVREAQRAGVNAVRNGVTGAHVDGVVRAVFAREGLEHEYVHGTGHGIGLYIHEEPILSPRCEAVLQSNEVVTVEPGLYRGGVGGVRIEDQVVVTGTGCRILTLSPKELSCPRSPQTI